MHENEKEKGGNNNSDWMENYAHNNPTDNRQVFHTFYLVMQIGITMLVTIFICLGLGYAVDHFLGTHLMVIFIILGVVAGFRSVYILIKKFVGIGHGKS